MKVFLDTNVLVAAFATRGLCADVLRLVLAEHELVVTEVVVEDLGRVLTQRIGLPPSLIEAVDSLLSEFVVAADPAGTTLSGLRDPSDIPIVRSAIAAGAEVLVTGDKDLLEADLPTRTVSPRGLWELTSSLSSRPEEVHEGR